MLLCVHVHYVTNLQQSLTLMSSAHHPHIVHTSSTHHLHETSVAKLFQVKQQRTALLKIGKECDLKSFISQHVVQTDSEIGTGFLQKLLNISPQFLCILFSMWLQII